MMEARESSVAKGFAEGERGYRRSAESTMLCGRCWAAGEYVADCHESGELSLVKGGFPPCIHSFLSMYSHEFFVFVENSWFFC